MAVTVNAYSPPGSQSLTTAALLVSPGPAVRVILFVADAECYVTYSNTVSDGGAIGTTVHRIPANTTFPIEVISKPIFVAAVSTANAYLLGLE